MAHLDLHPRGDHEPDVELHLMVHEIYITPFIGSRIIVSDPAHPCNDQVEMDEQFVDYMDLLIPGRMNQFLVPLPLALEWGLVKPGDVGQ